MTTLKERQRGILTQRQARHWAKAIGTATVMSSGASRTTHGTFMRRPEQRGGGYRGPVRVRQTGALTIKVDPGYIKDVAWPMGYAGEDEAAFGAAVADGDYVAWLKIISNPAARSDVAIDYTNADHPIVCISGDATATPFETFSDISYDFAGVPLAVISIVSLRISRIRQHLYGNPFFMVDTRHVGNTPNFYRTTPCGLQFNATTRVHYHAETGTNTGYALI